MWLLKDNEIVNVYDHIDFPRPMTQTRVGRIYEQTVGYFDVQTQTPLNYFSNFTFYPQSGGPIILTGADNTKIRATSESCYMDLDADGTYETPITESWEDISRKAIASSLLAN